MDLAASVRRMVLRKKASSSKSSTILSRREEDGPLDAVCGSPNLRMKLLARASEVAPTQSAQEARNRFVENMLLLWKGPHSFRQGRQAESYHLHVPVVDTVLFEAGEPKTWLFTSAKTGRFLKKNDDNVDLRSIAKAFGQRAEELFWSSGKGGYMDAESRATSTSQQYVAVARFQLQDRDQLRVEFLKAHQLLALFDSPKQLAQLVALQSCASLRDYSAVYSCRYRLAENGIRTEFETVRLTNDRGIMGSLEGESYQRSVATLLSSESRERLVYVSANEVEIKSQVKTINKEVEKLVTQIVKFIETTRPGCSIDSLRAEFIYVQGQPATLTHISGVSYRRPYVRRLESLSANSEDSESEVSMFSSRSSVSIFSNGENSNNKSNKRNASPPQTVRTMEEEVHGILRGPLGASRGKLRCWGQYCDLGKEQPNSDAWLPGEERFIVNEESKVHPATRTEESGEYGLAGEFKVTLLQIVLTSIQKVHVRRAHSMAKGGAIEFSIDRVEAPAAVSAGKISSDHRISTRRLYASVDVCKTCFKIYHMIQDQRPTWDVPEVTEPDETAESFNTAIRQADRLLGALEPINLQRSIHQQREQLAKPSVCRPMFLKKLDKVIPNGVSVESKEDQRPMPNEDAQHKTTVEDAKAKLSRQDPPVPRGALASRPAKKGTVAVSARDKTPACVQPEGFAREIEEYIENGKKLTDGPAQTKPLSGKEAARAEVQGFWSTPGAIAISAFSQGLVSEPPLIENKLHSDQLQHFAYPVRSPDSCAAESVRTAEIVTQQHQHNQHNQRQHNQHQQHQQQHQVNVHKTYRVAALHNKLSKELDTSLSSTAGATVHPPLFSLRRKTFIPSEKEPSPSTSTSRR